MVQLMATAATAAATGVGSTAASLVGDLVRTRLAGAGQNAAVATFDAAPQEPAAQAVLHSALVTVMAADQPFVVRLTSVMPAPEEAPAPAQPANVASGGGITVQGTGNKVRGNFAGRDQIINNIRNGDARTLAVLTLAVLILALAVYGGVRLGGAQLPQDGDAPPSSAPSVSRATGAALPPTTATVRRILPDRKSVDSRAFPQAETPHIATSAAGLFLCRAAPECQKNATAVGGVEYDPKVTKDSNPGNHAEFLVVAFPDATTAHLAYVDLVDGGIEKGLAFEHEIAGLGDYGEESQGFSSDSGPTASMYNRVSVFRYGAFIGMAHQLDDGTPERVGRLRQLSTILADRMAKADAGQIP
ncbi:hypothetical protein A8713_08560 [Streptomyces sp. SAT1]|uniref:hypothetical protein n=1 Tax=Streptomyces sp. SAT1 TaxID=1849967 RepID=UPI0007DCE6F7|nr:hypothetical protein [Streptomyces sp. SAT1]ANH91223.1 hypothetical protein A8713_08560 [Streptomyces sp. SAT1]